MTSNRGYAKQVYRLPKRQPITATDPVELFAALLVKKLRRHAWPAGVRPLSDPLGVGGFEVYPLPEHGPAGPDFWEAVAIAVRITASAYRVNAHFYQPAVLFETEYRIDKYGAFKEVI